MDGMVVRRAVRFACLIWVAALLAPACQRALSSPAAKPAAIGDFHYGDPQTIAATGRPQLLEFVGPT